MVAASVTVGQPGLHLARTMSRVSTRSSLSSTAQTLTSDSSWSSARCTAGLSTVHSGSTRPLAASVSTAARWPSSTGSRLRRMNASL